MFRMFLIKKMITMLFLIYLLFLQNLLWEAINYSKEAKLSAETSSISKYSKVISFKQFEEAKKYAESLYIKGWDGCFKFFRY